MFGAIVWLTSKVMKGDDGENVDDENATTSKRWVILVDFAIFSIINISESTTFPRCRQNYAPNLNQPRIVSAKMAAHCRHKRYCICMRATNVSPPV